MRRTPPRHRHARGRRVLASATTLALAGIVGASAAAAYWGVANPVRAESPVGTGFVSVSIGEVPQLYPGLHGSFTITVRNEGASAFAVRGVRVTGGVWPAGCLDSVEVAPPEALPVIPPAASRTMDVAISLRPDAPPGCQGLDVDLPLHVEGDWT